MRFTNSLKALSCIAVLGFALGAVGCGPAAPAEKPAMEAPAEEGSAAKPEDGSAAKPAEDAEAPAEEAPAE